MATLATDEEDPELARALRDGLHQQASAPPCRRASGVAEQQNFGVGSGVVYEKDNSELAQAQRSCFRGQRTAWTSKKETKQTKTTGPKPAATATASNARTSIRVDHHHGVDDTNNRDDDSVLDLLNELWQDERVQHSSAQHPLSPSREEVKNVVQSPRRRQRRIAKSLKSWKFLSILLACMLMALVTATIVLLTKGYYEWHTGVQNECSTYEDCPLDKGRTTPCALSEFDVNAPKVCCVETVEVDAYQLSNSDPPNNFIDKAYVCTHLPDGSKCGNLDHICASGICLDSTCQPAKSRLGSKAVCSEDSDCESNACRHESLGNTKKVCCPSSIMSFYSEVCDGTTLTDNGKLCERDSSCSSGWCSGGICVEPNAVEVGEVCTQSRECETAACGLDVAVADDESFPPYVCCKSGQVVNDSTLGSREYSRPFCKYRPTGTFCRYLDAMCASNLCINQYCADEKLDVGEACERDNDCKNDACGLPSLDSRMAKTCCETDESYSILVDEKSGQTELVCAGQPVGALCKSYDSICASSACINELCVHKLDVGQECTENSHCTSNACGLTVANASVPTTCCESGETVNAYISETGETLIFCASMPVGTYCDTIDSICESGMCIDQVCADEALEDNAPCTSNAYCSSNACGQKDLLIGSPQVCCESGSSIAVYKCDGELFENSNACYSREEVRVCDKLPTGAYCDNIASVCASGICYSENCANEALDANKECRQDSDCKSKTCAHAIADASAPTVCCESGESIIGNALNGEASVCTRAPLGTYCHKIDDMCESGSCIARTCSTGKLDVSSPCFEPTECQNNACGLTEARSDASRMCCESGDTVRGSIQSDPPTFDDVCSQALLGTYCNKLDAMCESGLCINGRCGNETLDDYQVCTMPSNCKSNECALSEADVNADMVCCSRGEADYFEVLGDDKVHRVCQNLPLGSYCHKEDRLCENGLVCVAGQCAKERLGLFQNCTLATDCQSNTCVLSSADANAYKVCIDKGSEILTNVRNNNNEDYVAQNLPLRTYCHETDDLCASKICVRGYCAEKRLEPLENCTLPTDCEDEACALASIDDDHEISSLVCCVGGGSIELPPPNNRNSDPLPVCSNAPEGTTCRDVDAICASGFCGNGKCAAARLDDEMECQDESHSSCKSSACALASAASSELSLICCKEGERLTVNRQNSYSYETVSVCGKRPPGVYCGIAANGVMCQSGVCTPEEVCA